MELKLYKAAKEQQELKTFNCTLMELKQNADEPKRKDLELLIVP